MRPVIDDSRGGFSSGDRILFPEVPPQKPTDILETPLIPVAMPIGSPAGTGTYPIPFEQPKFTPTTIIPVSTPGQPGQTGGNNLGSTNQYFDYQKFLDAIGLTKQKEIPAVGNTIVTGSSPAPTTSVPIIQNSGFQMDKNMIYLGIGMVFVLFALVFITRH